MGAFTGKTVLTPSGSCGIGATVVCRSVVDGAGIRFAYTGPKDAAKCLAREAGTTAVFTDSVGRDAVVDVVRKNSALGTLTVDAGIGVLGEALELNTDDTDRLLEINIHASYHASVGAARQMPEGERILTIDSVDGGRMLIAGMTVYVASKSILQGMACGLARDSGPCRITIDVVQSGPIDIDANPVNGPMYDMLHSSATIKRHGQPEEVVGTVAWLTGPEASSIIGMIYTIDGASGA